MILSAKQVEYAYRHEQPLNLALSIVIEALMVNPANNSSYSITFNDNKNGIVIDDDSYAAVSDYNNDNGNNGSSSNEYLYQYSIIESAKNPLFNNKPLNLSVNRIMLLLWKKKKNLNSWLVAHSSSVSYRSINVSSQLFCQRVTSSKYITAC